MSSAPGALARVRVVVSRSVVTYSAPSVPLAGTAQLHRTATYMCCLSCAGAPRPPASGSGLSLTTPSWHAVLYDPGEFDTHKFQRRDVDIGLRRDLSGSALPMIPQIRFTRGPISGLPGSQLLRPVRLLAPLHGSDRSPSHRGLLLPGFQRSRLVAGYDYSIDWTPMLAGLSPAGMAARLAAPDPYVPISSIRFFTGEFRSQRCSDGRFGLLATDAALGGYGSDPK